MFDGDTCRIELVDPISCSRETLEAAERALPRLLGAELIPFKLECGNREDEEGLRYRGITLHLLEQLRYSLLDCLRRLSLSGREYFYLAGWNGEYAIGAGDEYSITLPSVPGVVFAHTHPGLCYPSGRDLSSFADFLSSGGLIEAIVSPACSMALYLEEPLAEDDYWELLEAGKCVNKARTSEEYTTCLTRISSLRTVKAQML
jgi:hypothetical protein